MPPPLRIKPTKEPLKLSPAERHGILVSLHMEKGWLILSRAEMMGMHQNMQQAADEVKRLNGELAGVIAKKLTEKNEVEEWKRWVRFVLADPIPADATKDDIRKSVVAAWDKLQLRVRELEANLKELQDDIRGGLPPRDIT